MTQVGLWLWDKDYSTWVKAAGTSAGALSIHAIVEKLDDIEDVDVATPTDQHIIYRDDAAGKWKAKAIWTAAHKDTHDPIDGSDKLDTAAPVKVGEANAIGSSHSFPRADHVHEKHHAKYTDAEAVTAMGAKANDNPLHHDRAAEWGAAEHTAIGDAAPHHAKYTDAEAVTAAEAAGLGLASGKNIRIHSSLTTDNHWSGLDCWLLAGENLVIGNAVYIKNDGKAWKADADAATTMPAMAICTGTVDAEAAGKFLLIGYMRVDAWDWTPAGSLYTSTTAGALTQTPPTGAGDQHQPVGIAVTADIIHFNPTMRHHAIYTDAKAKAQAEGAKLDDHAAPDDNTDLDATPAKHGLMSKVDAGKCDGISAGHEALTTGAHGFDKSCRAYHDAAQAIGNASWTALALNQERWDTDTIHDLVTNNSRLTCKTAGKYLIIGCAVFATNNDGIRAFAIYEGGTTRVAEQRFTATQGAFDTRATVSTILDMAVNDYVEFKVYQNSGGELDIQSEAQVSPEFMMARIA